MIKQIFKAIILGAATTIGSIIAKKAADKVSNPVWQAKMKRKFKLSKTGI